MELKKISPSMLKISNKQVSHLATLTREVGNIGLASILIPSIIGAFQSIPALVGFFFAVFFWLISIILIQAL
jgi:hypothetical protein